MLSRVIAGCVAVLPRQQGVTLGGFGWLMSKNTCTAVLELDGDYS